MNGDFESWPSGIKRTKPRESILSVLKKSEKPLSAMEIYAETQKMKQAVSLSTIYRALELFVKKGTVIKLAIMHNELAVYELNRSQHKHYAVCLGCHKILPMGYCPMEKLLPKMIDGDFEVLGHNLEVYGYCKECNNKWNNLKHRICLSDIEMD